MDPRVSDSEMVTQPGGIEWRVSATPVDYPAAVEEMEGRVAAIRAGTDAELVWLLDHPPLYTAGTSARDEELLEPGRLPVHRTGRGGQDVRCYVHQLEEWTIRTLARFAVRGERRDGRVGIWVVRPMGNEEKIA